MKQLDIYGKEYKNNLTLLRYRITRIIFVLAFLAIFSTSFSKLFGLTENSLIIKFVFYLSIFFGLSFLFLDKKLRKLDIKYNEFKSQLETKEDFHKVLLEVLSVKPQYNFATKEIEKLHDELTFPFTSDDLEKYVAKWKKINSIFSYRLPDDTPETTLSLLILPIITIKDVAILIGAKEFARHIISSGLKHGLLQVNNEFLQDGELIISYDIHPNYAQHNIAKSGADTVNIKL